MEQMNPKPITQSKTAIFNVLLIVLFPIIRAGVVAGLDYLGIGISDDEAHKATQQIITLLPEIIAILPVVAGNIYLRLITTGPATLGLKDG